MGTDAWLTKRLPSSPSSLSAIEARTASTLFKFVMIIPPNKPVPISDSTLAKLSPADKVEKE